MTLRAKLLCAQVPLAVALAAIAWVAMRDVTFLGRQAEAVLQDNYRSVLAAQRMTDAAQRLHDRAALALIQGPAAAAGAAGDPYRQQFEDELRVQEHNITEPGEAEATARLRQAWTAYLDRSDHLRTLRDPERARAVFLDDLEPAFAALVDAVGTILTINQDVIVQKSEEAHTAAERTGRVMLMVSLVALLLGGVASLLLTTRWLAPLGLLTEAVHHVAAGDFSARVEVVGHDELAQLAATINAMAKRLSQYRNSSLGELLLAQQASQAAIDSLPDPVVVFDLSGSVLNVNQAAEAVLGIGVKPEAELPPAVQDVLRRVRGYVLGGKGAYVPKGLEEAVVVSAPEGARYLLPHAAPVYAESGGIAGATVVLQDVTRLRLVDELRNDLVATVAHEFRTPLTALRMALHLCLEQAAGPLTDRQADLLYTAREDCERLQSMVDELLDLARIQGGQVELHVHATAPALLIETAVGAYRQTADEQRVVLQSVVAPGTREVWVDRERIQLVLSNLLSNAIRHTAAGGAVEVRARPVDDRVRFEVADTGPGIPRELQPKVFEKFVRLPGAVGAGAGLGLSIAKELVQAHGGEIGVEDTPGGGATFWFTLPTTAATPAPSPTPVET